MSERMEMCSKLSQDFVSDEFSFEEGLDPGTDWPGYREFKK